MPPRFDLQGHRGCRGLKPENTLPAFEVAFDLGVTSIETDVHLTKDDVPVLFHDARVTDALCRRLRGTPPPHPCHRPLIRDLTLEQMRNFRADCNPDARRFPDQDPRVTPLAAHFAREHGIDPYTPPTLQDLFAFAEAYAGAPGTRAGKTPEKQERARGIRFDLELKRVPFRLEYVGEPGLLERRVVEVIREAGVVGRTDVRSFDHRSVRRVREMEPGLGAGVLIAGTAPVSAAELVRQAGATGYYPQYEFVDREMVEELHAAGMRVVPWTVNEPAAWERLLEWGVDGITTDFPDQLAALLHSRDIVHLSSPLSPGFAGERGRG